MSAGARPQAGSSPPVADYLFTMHAPGGGPPQMVDAGLGIYHTASDGSGRIEGPRLNGRLRPPSGDWLQILPGGTLRVDARVSIEADDGGQIYMAYGGAIAMAPETFARMQGGAVLGPDEMYFMIAPVFRTAAPAHAWLNGVQAAGRAVALKGGPGGYVTYEVWALR
jgi:hypothetical protein